LVNKIKNNHKMIKITWKILSINLIIITFKIKVTYSFTIEFCKKLRKKLKIFNQIY
jgi:hypothetical protein